MNIGVKMNIHTLYAQKQINKKETKKDSRKAMFNKIRFFLAFVT